MRRFTKHLDSYSCATLLTRLQFALVFRVQYSDENTVRSPFFFLEDIRDFVRDSGEVKLVLDGASFTLSEETAYALKVLKEGTHGFDWKERKTPSSKLIEKKAEVLSTPKFRELKSSIDRLLVEKDVLVKAQSYGEAGKLRDKEKELWQQIEQMMLDACRDLVDE